MRRTAAIAVVLVGLAAAAPAAAHMIPGDRTIVAQPECDSVALLVAYHAPSGTRGELLDQLIRRVPDSRRRAVAEAAMTVRALAGIRLELDGRDLPWESIQVKLTEDPPGSGRAVAVVLVTAKIPAGPHVVRLHVENSGDPTSVSWIDRSHGRVAEWGPVDAGTQLQGTAILEWRWRAGRDQCAASN